jgi:small conductance mechanosensitive channel
MAPGAARAQLPLPIPIPSASPASPFGIAIKRVGPFDTAPIYFEGVRLFNIAAYPSNDPTAIPPIVLRVETIQDNLRRIVPSSKPGGYLQMPESRFDPDTFKVEVGNENGYPTLYATDGRRKDVAPIMTLTEADAALQGQSSAELADNWEAVLQTALGPAVLAAQPEYFRSQLQKIPLVVVLIGGLLWLFSMLRRTWSARHDVIRDEVKNLDPESDAQRVRRLRLQVRLLSTAEWISNGLSLLVVALGLLWVLTIFPGTRTFARELSSQIIRIAILWVSLVIVDRIVSLILVQVISTWEGNPFMSGEARSRQALRRPTIIGAADNLKTIVLYAVGIGWSFSILSINTASILTISAVVAFAVSFAAQSIIKDYVNGFLMLAEDQFAIGDYVTINAVTGAVENLTLRITQIRTDEGRLVTMPNSTITTVENATRSWARIDFRVSVATNSDVDKAITTLQTALNELAADPAFAGVVLEPPQVLGVDSVSNAGIVLRAWVKVAPSERGAIAREINRRVDEAFRKQSVSIAVPQTMLVQPQVQENGPAAAAAKE